jgi:hypothetical protein
MKLIDPLLALLFSSPEVTPAPSRWSPVDVAGVIDLRDEAARSQAPCEHVFDCGDARAVWVDLEALHVGEGGLWLSYDYAEVTRPLRAAELPGESELSLAVRLIVSEVGADRLLQNRYALGEAIGILYTVDNRLDPLIYNIIDEPTAPVFPGCGAEGAFWSCANAQQYLGMGTWRAFDPASRYPSAMLEAATDLAVLGWWLQENRLIADFTEGATNYVHRCGGAAYGLPTWRCDAHIGNSARDDVPGANPYTGPIVFRGPSVWSDRRGVYTIDEVRRLEYDAWWHVDEWLDSGDGLADAGDDVDDLARGAVVSTDGLASASEIAAPPQLAAVINGVGPVRDPAALRALILGRD